MENKEFLSEFLNDPKGVLIAPAGHGKTYSIAQMISLVEAEKPQLILTHTHAGVASLKKKFRKLNVPSDKYNLETISSFTQRYVLSLCWESEILLQEDKKYFDRIYELAVSLFSKPAVKRIIKQSYSHLYVDEYQDCTKEQHKFIMLLAEELPVHLLGDPLQGIFDFNTDVPMVDFETDLSIFHRYNFLQTPWRWKNVGKESLGQHILAQRKSLLEKRQVSLRTDSEAGCFIHKATSLQRVDFFLKELGPFIRQLCDRSNNVLVIFPAYKDGKVFRGTIYDRCSAKLQMDVQNKFTLIEAIDDPLYYKAAKFLDELIEHLPKEEKPYKKLQESLEQLSFGKTEIKDWLTEKKVKSKRTPDKRALSEKLSCLAESLRQEPSVEAILIFLSMVKQDLKLRPKRADVLSSILLCLNEAKENGVAILDAMKNHKNRIRRMGRKIEGHCIGTTLLTKGLEFNIVVLIEADKMKSSKDFYVAISRASKELHIFTLSDTLHFDK